MRLGKQRIHCNRQLNTQTSILLAFISYFYLARSLSENEVSRENRIKFESLLASGKTLTLPFSAGYLLSLASNDLTNWNVTWSGFENSTGITPFRFGQTYASLLRELKKDENTTITGTIYALREGRNETKIESQLGTEIKRVEWDQNTANETWALINEDVANKTNNKVNGTLIPEDNELGNPFPFSTQAVLIATFHYKNSWTIRWKEDAPRSFPNSGVVPFLKSEGEFLVAREEDYTAVGIPLEGGIKSLVFVLPKVNITKFFLRSISKRRTEEDSEPGNENSETDADAIPFPNIWHRKLIKVFIPSFNYSTPDQYGRKLAELGLNETFCTTVHDRRGRFPYYMRPLAQYNSIELRSDSVEIASATGTAVQKFYLGLDFVGKGYPRFDEEFSQDYGRTEATSEEPTVAGSTANFPDKREKELSNKEEEKPINSSSSSQISQLSSLSLSSSKEGSRTEESQITPNDDEIIVFDRPFLFYLNDTRTGPLFYGIVQKIDHATEIKEEDAETVDLKGQAERFLLWTCRGFKQSDSDD